MVEAIMGTATAGLNLANSAVQARANERDNRYQATAFKQFFSAPQLDSSNAPIYILGAVILALLLFILFKK